MSDLQLDARLDAALAALREESEPAVVTRLIVRANAPVSVRPTSSTRLPLRLTMIAFTATLAVLALWPRGSRAMAFAQVREATLASSHSIARTYERRTGREVVTVLREGERYATLQREWSDGRLSEEVRSDGRRKLLSLQRLSRETASRTFPLGYRHATIEGDLGLRDIYKQDALATILKAYEVEAPEPLRVGNRLRYRLPEPAGRNRIHPGGFVVEADATSGRILEIRDSSTRTVVDYESPIPDRAFEFRPQDRDVLVIDVDALRPILKRDMDAGAGAWLDGEGKLWLVYRGSVATPPTPAGLVARGFVRAEPYARGPVVAVGVKLGRLPPEALVVRGRRVPVRKIGRISYASILFHPLPSSRPGDPSP